MLQDRHLLIHAFEIELGLLTLRAFLVELRRQLGARGLGLNQGLLGLVAQRALVL